MRIQVLGNEITLDGEPVARLLVSDHHIGAIALRSALDESEVRATAHNGSGPYAYQIRKLPA